ncbi:uncharacterized protein YbjT (DUF2867 family) [Stackebrandtia endophytica]|uniref:Uncharacterized protein YbjT (DUF2867 family) n=1 Tax=Stackebrandtia endophytica TaxID=1496996 RepID=A0A543AWY8_9ACTN|nr:NmrA family NAD(P)-binding protein [Stackebrandtia endophytica]TQL77069.1 uncharacterized protein YbjT (DUF2867 family) [Stackebrandtia endophytica]
MNTSQQILVTGATGQQGGAVAATLLRDGWSVRALTRDAGRPAARALAEAGAQVVEGDFDDPASLARAVNGVYGVFSVHSGSYDGSPDGYDADHEICSAQHLAEAAAAAGVRHLVHSSSVGVDRPELAAVMAMLRTKGEAERRIRTTGVSVTFLRPASFMENLLGGVRGLTGGALVNPQPPEFPEPLIAVTDIAAVAALAFAEPDQHRDKAYDLAGDAVTQPEIAATISETVGREVPFRRIPIEEIRAVSEDTATALEAMSRLDLAVDIEAVRTMHPGLLTFREWAERHREALLAAVDA